MKVKLLVSRSGLNGSQLPGEEIEVGDAEGERMIAAGQARRLDEVRTAPVQTATAKAKVEKAVK